MSKYTSTYIVRADPGYDQLKLKESILKAVNTLTAGEKRIYREWIKLEIENPHPTTHYWIFISSANYLQDRKPCYFYFSFRRTLQLLPKDFPLYFPGFDVVSSRLYSIKSKDKEELAKFRKWTDLEGQMLKQIDEHLKMEESIRSLQEKLAEDKENFLYQLKISAEEINLLNTRLQNIITAKHEENTSNEDLKNNKQCSIF